jgi:chorismate dehydratase
VALARIILAERYGLRPEFMDLTTQRMKDEGGRQKAEPDRPLPVHPSSRMALLLIGDKVVAEEPAHLPHQLDLGEAWKEWTGLPFTFAAWMARGGADLGDLPARLAAARRAGLANIDRIVARHAGPRGWPPDVARRYLTEYLQFDVTPRHLEAMWLFHRLAAKHGIIPGPPRELDVLGG